MKLVANENLEVSFDNQSGPSDLVYAGDQGTDPVKVVPILSTKCSAAGKKIASDSLAINFLATTPCPHTSATHVFVAGTASISATSEKVFVEAGAVLREGDVSMVGCRGTWTNTASGATVPCACDVEISDAGQTEVSAE